MKLLALAALVVLGAQPAIAWDSRSASEEEIAAALLGCWVSDGLAGWVEKRCFGPGDQVTTTWSDKANASDVTDHRTFEVVGGKLRMVGVLNFEGDAFPSEEVCDVRMRPNVAMRLENCFTTNDFGDEVISEPANYNIGYSKVSG